MIKDEIDRNPDLDMAEAIIRITSGNVFNRLANTQEEDWDEVELSKLIKETNALIRATSVQEACRTSKIRRSRIQPIEEFKSTAIFNYGERKASTI